MSTPLEAALDAINAVSADPIIIAKCRALMRGYDARWGNNHPWITVETELPFTLPIMNPETGKPKRIFSQAGKYDGIIRKPGSDRLYLIEHKTTAEDTSDPSALYWQMLAVDSQLSFYALASHMEGRTIEGIVYDVIRKPGTNPKRVPAGDKRKKHKVDGKMVPLADEDRENTGTIQEILADGTFWGQPVSCDVVEGMTETPELYEARLTHEILIDLERRFQRKYVARLDSDMVEFAQEMVEIADVMMDARRRDAYYRNPNSCRRFGSTCTYLPICAGYDNPDSGRWYIADQVHAELPIVFPNGGRDVMTNSRNKTFQACRREDKFRYEIGLRRVDSEEKEALVMGSVIHIGLENWLNEFKEEESNVNRNESGQVGTSGTQAELAF